MQFEVNGTKYLLQFSPDEGEWFLLRPSELGIERLGIESDTDAPRLENSVIPVETDPLVN